MPLEILSWLWVRFIPSQVMGIIWDAPAPTQLLQDVFTHLCKRVLASSRANHMLLEFSVELDNGRGFYLSAPQLGFACFCKLGN